MLHWRTGTRLEISAALIPSAGLMCFQFSQVTYVAVSWPPSKECQDAGGRQTGTGGVCGVAGINQSRGGIKL